MKDRQITYYAAETVDGDVKTYAHAVLHGITVSFRHRRVERGYAVSWEAKHNGMKYGDWVTLMSRDKNNPKKNDLHEVTEILYDQAEETLQKVSGEVA